MSENVEIYTTGKSFTLPPAVVTAGTNLTPGGSQVQIADGGGNPKNEPDIFPPFFVHFFTFKYWSKNLVFGPKTFFSPP